MHRRVRSYMSFAEVEEGEEPRAAVDAAERSTEFGTVVPAETRAMLLSSVFTSARRPPGEYRTRARANTAVYNSSFGIGTGPSRSVLIDDAPADDDNSVTLPAPIHTQTTTTAGKATDFMTSMRQGGRARAATVAELAERSSVIFGPGSISDADESDVDVQEAEEQRRRTNLPTEYAGGHEFTPAILAKLSSFESIDFTQPVTELYVEHLREIAKHGGRRLKLLVIFMIGVVVGLWATMLFHTIDELTRLKENFVLGVVAEHGHGLGYLAQLGCAVGFSIVAAGTCYVYPSAAGSGVPDMMAYLNGVHMHGAFNMRILLFKSISCIGSVCSGLPCGAEGPMIHIGALIGKGIGSGHSRTLGIGKGNFRGLFRSLQTARDRRDFTTTGAAAGVTSVFGSPLGGLLFVMEEVASFFPQRLAWKTFVACLLTFAIQQFCNSRLDGWVTREVSDASPISYFNPRSQRMANESATDTLTILESAAALFNMRQNAAQIVPLDLRSFLPAALIGLLCAFLGVAFIKLNLLIAAKWRGVRIRPYRYRFSLEPIVVTALFATIWFVLALSTPCEPIPPNFFDPTREDLRDLVLVTQFCSENGANRNAGRYAALEPAGSASRPSKSPSSYASHVRNLNDLFSVAPKVTFPPRTTSTPPATTIGPTITATPPGTTTQVPRGTTTLPPSPSSTTTSAPATPLPSTLPTHHSPVATLTMTSSYNAIRLMFSRHAQTQPGETTGEYLFPPYALIIFLIVYGMGAAYVNGMAISCGVVIPTLVIGATTGRLLCGGWWQQPYWASPGVAALIGAAAFFSGLSRLTFSVVVIMVEITNDLAHTPLLMMAVLIARQVADRFTHSLYHEQLQQRGVPFLDFDSQVHKLDCFTAGDVMSPSPITTPIVTTVRDIVKLLREGGELHHGFPVVLPVKASRRHKAKARPRGQARGASISQEPNLTALGLPSRSRGGSTRSMESGATFRVTNTATNAPLRPSPSVTSVTSMDGEGGTTNSSFNTTENPSDDPRTKPSSTPVRPKFLGLITREDLRRLLWYLTLWNRQRERERGSVLVGNADDAIAHAVASLSDTSGGSDDGSDNANQPSAQRLRRIKSVFRPRVKDFPPVPTYKDLQDVDDARFWLRLKPMPEEFDALGETSPASPAAIAQVPRWVQRTADLDIDLTPFLDLSANFVLDSTCVSQVYGLFRNLNLRHMCVVDTRNGLKGIITRRDLLGPSLEARCTEAYLRQLEEEERMAMSAGASSSRT
jgi:H+/Cl- antiporter ClcA/CBS domain-containing protein